MISAAVPSFWGSSLEDHSSRRSAFAVSEVSPIGYVELSLQGAQDVFGTEELFSIDESLFDLVEVPELEDCEVSEQTSPAAVAPFEDLILDEIPPLEDPSLDETILAGGNQQWFDWAQMKNEPAPVGHCPIQKVSPRPPVATTAIAVADEAICEKEEIMSSSPVSMYAERCGSESPSSCYSMLSDELSAPAEKKRRVSQISMSSYCSSSGDPSWSPTSASDSDVDSRRGGRRSRFSPADRKERKKAQNRTAAERYRQKRKMQEETVGEEEQQLINGNNELKTEVTKLQAEISCLKRLMREMLQAKGVTIPPPPLKRKVLSLN